MVISLTCIFPFKFFEFEQLLLLLLFELELLALVLIILSIRFNKAPYLIKTSSPLSLRPRFSTARIARNWEAVVVVVVVVEEIGTADAIGDVRTK